MVVLSEPCLIDKRKVRNDAWELASGDRQINKMVAVFQSCYIKVKPELREEQLRGWPYFKYCDWCCFDVICRINYDHYCNSSVRLPLTESDFGEFKNNMEILRQQADMFALHFSWKELEEDEI